MLLMCSFGGTNKSHNYTKLRWPLCTKRAVLWKDRVGCWIKAQTFHGSEYSLKHPYFNGSFVLHNDFFRSDFHLTNMMYIFYILANGNCYLSFIKCVQKHSFHFHRNSLVGYFI